MSVIWVSPESVIEESPWDYWNNKDNVKDEDTGTYASMAVPSHQWSTYLLMIPEDELWCSKLRFWAQMIHNKIDQIKLKAYDTRGDIGWVEKIWDHYPSIQWVEWDMGNIYYIENVEVSFYNSYGSTQTARFHEFDFGNVALAARPQVGGSLAGNILVGKGLA